MEEKGLSRQAWWNVNIFFLLSYLLQAAVSIRFFHTEAIWPAAGAAFAAVWLWGDSLWGAVAVAAFFSTGLWSGIRPVEVWSIANLVAAVGTAMGAVIGSHLLQKVIGKRGELDSVRGLWYMVGVGGGSYSLITAIVDGLMLNSTVHGGLFDWFVSNLVGIAIIAPLLILMQRPPSMNQEELWELVGVGGIVFLVCFTLFGPLKELIPYAYHLESLMLLPLFWAAVRFHPFVTALLLVMIFYLGWWGTAAGYGIFGLDIGGTGVWRAQLFFGFSAVFLLSAALVAEKQRNTAEALRQLNQELEGRVESRTFELAQMNERLEQLATVDSLTGVYNRRHFTWLMEKEAAMAQREGVRFAVILFDVDYFKKVNDTYGHMAGDEVLKAIAATAVREVRPYDVVGRYGGEEFVVLLPGADIAQGVLVAERLRQSMAETSVRYENQTIKVTVSFGVTQWSSEEDAGYRLLGRADQALYLAKERGRNRVAVVAKESEAEAGDGN